MGWVTLDAATLLTAANAVGLDVAAHDGRLVVKGPKGAAGLVRLLLEHEADVLAVLAADESSPDTDPTDPPASEPPGPPVGSVGPGPPPADRSWRTAVARWPVEWRERWGRRANEVEFAGAAWIEAEWSAFGELARDQADAERRGEVVCLDLAPGLSDAEAVAVIDRAFGDPAPARRSDRGPRDVRHGPSGALTDEDHEETGP
jgi:hypothetical protein